MGSGELTALAEEAALGGAGVPAENAAPLATYPDNVSIADLLRRLPDRDLTQTELEALAAGIAHQPEAWAHHVAFDADDRVYVSLHRDAHVDVWMLCWTPENDTGWHDHDVSSGAVAVVAGELVENNLTLAHGARETSVPGGTGVLLRARPHPPAQRRRARLDQRARLQPAAVADGPVRRQRRRRPAPGLVVLRRRAAPDRLTQCDSASARSSRVTV